jgi:hypothetical protein
MRLLLAGLAALALSAPASAGEIRTVTLTLKDHRFTPSAFSVAAGEKVRIEVINQDGATEEFDSHDLKVEELVTPHGRASFTIGPLKTGTYAFMGEFHPATAQGRVAAVDRLADGGQERSR